MKHPAREEWIAYLYDETAPAEKTALDAHAQSCPECRAHLESLQQTRAVLDEWQLPLARRRSFAGRSLARWAAAAAIVLCVGFAIGRSTASNSREVAALRVEMKQLAAQSKVEAGVETVRLVSELNESWKAQLQAAQLQHDADYASLRKELETVAVLTEASLRQAQQQLLTLAEYTQPVAANNKP